MERLESFVAVHTHTDSLINKIVRDDKSFNISRNIRNLKENCKF